MAASPEIAAGRADIAAIAAEIFATLGTAGQVTPFTSRPAGLSIDDAYRVSAALHAMREARGEKPRGRKIGFTNRTIWHPIRRLRTDLGLCVRFHGPRSRRRHGVAARRFRRAADRTGDRVRPIRRAGRGHGRDGPAVLPGMGRARLRNRAVDLSAMEIRRRRYCRRQRRARRALDRAASRDRPARGRMADDCCRVSTSICLATAGLSTGAMPQTFSTARLPRSVILSGCWRTTGSIRRLRPARSSPPAR